MTISALYAWPDYDENDKWDGASMLGTYQGEAMAVVLKSRHHDAFLRLALAAPDMVRALERALEAISVVPNYSIPGRVGGSYAVASLIGQALAKAKGE
jgi:hypothetical protein